MVNLSPERTNLIEQDLDLARRALDRASTALLSGEDSSAWGAIREIDHARQGLDRLLAQAVRNGRESGMTWEDIGHALGMTRQSAHEKWAATCREA